MAPAPTSPVPFPFPLPRPSSYKSRKSSKSSYPPIPPIYTHLLQLPSLAAPFLPASVLAAFPAAVQQLLPQLSQLDEHLRILLPRTKNWTHEFFTAFLLSSRWRVATDRKLAYLLENAGPQGAASREETAARLLYSVACWRRDGYTGGRKTEVGWQIDGLLAAFCEPGLEMDRITLADDANAVVVWCCGRAWEVELFEEGEVKSVHTLYRELQALALAAEGMPPPDPSIAALSHRLPRSEWARAKAALGNTDAMARLYGSLLSLSLEDYPLPESTAAALDDIRGNTYSPNRFADQTCSVVVYANGRAGITVDHTVADCAAGLELSTWLSALATSAPIDGGDAELPETQPFRMLRFPKMRGPRVSTEYRDSVQRTVHTATLRLPQGVHEKRLTDFCLQLALQAAVGIDEAITQSIYQRGIVNGRSEPVMMVTAAGAEFLATRREEAFKAAWEARRERIKSQTFPFYLSVFLAPALAALPACEALTTLQEVVDVAAGNTSEVQFTGFTQGQAGVEAGLSNIAQPEQLAVFYVAKPGEYGEVEVAFSATGMWRWKVEKVVGRFVDAWEDICSVVVGDE